MDQLKLLYYQIENRKYLERTFGRELWVQVSGNRKLNSANAGFWAALISLEQSESSLLNPGWDSHIGTQEPGFVCSGSETVYERIQSPCENIVHYREFHGIKPDYVEIVEEFRLLNNSNNKICVFTFFFKRPIATIFNWLGINDSLPH